MRFANQFDRVCRPAQDAPENLQRRYSLEIEAMTNVATLSDADTSVEDIVRKIAADAKAASHALGLVDSETRNAALQAGANAIRDSRPSILAANEKDMAFGRERGLSDAMMDRLLLVDDRIEAMAKGLENITVLPDPLGRTIDERERPNGLKIARVSVPLGVIGVIYESRPNVTADAGALCLKSGNAAILRGGSESLHSSAAIAQCLKDGLRETGLPKARYSRSRHGIALRSGLCFGCRILSISSYRAAGAA